MAKGTRNQSSMVVAEPGVPAGSADSQRQYVGEIDRPVTDDQVAERAYELYQARGAQHGADLDDWLQAERELGRSASAMGRTGE